MAKKKKNKQPAKKRNKGVVIDLEIGIRNFNEKEDEKECIEELEDVQQDNEGLKININNILLDKAELFKIKKARNPKIEAVYTQIFMPYDTKQNLPKKIENLNLLINKFPLFELKNKNEIKPVYFDEYCTPKNYKKIAYDYYKKIKKINLKKENLKEIELTVDEKLIIGLGGASVYETSLTLHHIYGIPYIPGSAVKGSLRSYIISKYFEKELEEYSKLNKKNAYDLFENEVLFQKEKNEFKNKWFIDIFGSEENQGKVIFFDVFAVNDLTIKPDIMNPHYPKYYSGETYPTDDQSPVPIPFLSVKGKFKFVFGVKDNIDINIKGNKIKILDFVKENLENSLKEFGLGAKTAVGYGYFK